MNLKYDKNVHPKMIVKLMEKGLSITQCAAKMGVARETIHGWAKDPSKPEFMEAFRMAKTLSEAYHEQLLEDIITGKIKGNVIGQMYRMKCRFRDRYLETKKMEIEDSRSKQMTEEELDKRIAMLEEADKNDR